MSGAEAGAAAGSDASTEPEPPGFGAEPGDPGEGAPAGAPTLLDRGRELARTAWSPRWRRITVGSLLAGDAMLGLRWQGGLLDLLFEHDDAWLLQWVELLAASLTIATGIHVVLPGRRARRWALPGLILLVPVLLFIGTDLLLRQGGGATNAPTGAVFSISPLRFLLNGAWFGAAYLTMAFGLTLTYKVEGYGNFAAAEHMAWGWMIGVLVMWSDRFRPLIESPNGHLDWAGLLTALLLAAIICGCVGVLADQLVHRRLRRRGASPMTMMIASLGVALALRALAYIRMGNQARRIVPDVEWDLNGARFLFSDISIDLRLGELASAPWLDVVTGGEGASHAPLTYARAVLIVGIPAIVLLVMWILHSTRTGRAMRAVADDADLAAASGVHVERIHATSAFLSASVAGLGGVLVGMHVSMNPETALTYLLPAFAVIVLGTVGSLEGAFIAAACIGLVRAAADLYFFAMGVPLDRGNFGSYGQVGPYLMLILVLLVLPTGIGTRLQQARVERAKRRAEAERELDWRDRLRLATSRVRLALGRAIAPLLMLVDRAHMRWSTAVSAAVAAWFRRTSRATRAVLRDRAQRLFLDRRPVRVSLDRLASGRATLQHIAPHGRAGRRANWATFAFIMLIYTLTILWLPAVSRHRWWILVGGLLVQWCIYALFAMSLNVHSGMAGLLDFGTVVFFGIGALCVALLPAIAGWPIGLALVMALVLSGGVGWLLAYPTGRLRMDYFAIVTISLGEVLRITMSAEPLVWYPSKNSPGVYQFPLPFDEWWTDGPSQTVGDWLGLGGPTAPYVVFLIAIGVLMLGTAWFLQARMWAGPWGRILRGIREDEEVVEHHGHDTFHHKAANMALGAMVAAAGGALLAWQLRSLDSGSLRPAATTFLAWAAFVIGGRGNTRGMIVGAGFIVIIDRVLRQMAVARSDASHAMAGFVESVDGLLDWIVRDALGWLWSEFSITEVYRTEVTIEPAFLQLLILGCTMILVLLYAPRGLVPEVPYRPRPPAGAVLGARVSDDPLARLAETDGVVAVAAGGEAE